jgi:hypothetical protein
MLGHHIFAPDDLVIETIARIPDEDFRDMRLYSDYVRLSIELGNAASAGQFASIALRIAREAYDVVIARRESLA